MPGLAPALGSSGFMPCHAGLAESRIRDARGHARRLNNSDAHTFCDNCNVLLTAAMDKAGLSEFCEASEEVHLLTFMDMLLTSLMPLRGCTHLPAPRLSWLAGVCGLGSC